MRNGSMWHEAETHEDAVALLVDRVAERSWLEHWDHGCAFKDCRSVTCYRNWHAISQARPFLTEAEDREFKNMEEWWNSYHYPDGQQSRHPTTLAPIPHREVPA